MKQIYIWGAGYGARQVIEEIDDTKTIILGILDRDKRKQGADIFPEIPIISPYEIQGQTFDYIIISIKEYKAEIGRAHV